MAASLEASSPRTTLPRPPRWIGLKYTVAPSVAHSVASVPAASRTPVMIATGGGARRRVAPAAHERQEIVEQNGVRAPLGHRLQAGASRRDRADRVSFAAQHSRKHLP